MENMENTFSVIVIIPEELVLLVLLDALFLLWGRCFKKAIEIELCL